MKKGFTLVELLAVIVIIGLLMTLAIPAVLKVSNNVKEESYETKIKMITNAAVSYGDVIKKNHLLNRTSLVNTHPRHSWDCSATSGADHWITINSNKEVVCDNEDGEYPAYRMTVKELAEAKEISYDETDRCKSSGCENYNNVVKNPVTGNIINNCYVYIYYKNNRLYAIFDKKTCDQVDETTNGHEYKDTLA